MKTYVANSAVTEVSLEPLTNKHILKTFSWVSNPAFRSVFLLRGDVTWEGHEAYFSRVLQDPSQKLFAILHNNEHVGNCGYKYLDWTSKTGELWIYIGSPDMRGRGIGLCATKCLIREGVERFGLKKILLHVAKSNESARRMYLRCGFIEAGEAGGEWEGRDMLRMIRE